MPPLDTNPIPIVFMTGYGDVKITVKAMKAGAVDFLTKLTPRERQVMAYVVGGLRNKQIAQELSLSEITIKIHHMRAMEKMGIRSTAELARKVGTLDVSLKAS